MDLHMLQKTSSQQATKKDTTKNVPSMNLIMQNATLMIDRQLGVVEMQRSFLMRLRANSSAMASLSAERRSTGCSSCMSGATSVAGCAVSLDLNACISAVTAALPACMDCPTTKCLALVPAQFLCSGQTKQLAEQSGLISSDQLESLCNDNECASWTEPVGKVVSSVSDAVGSAWDATTSAVS